MFSAVLRRSCRVVSMGVLFVSALSTGTASALTINLNKGTTLLGNPAASAAFDQAAAFFESQFTDAVTININADLASLPSGVLGSASSSILGGGYDLIRNAVVADQLASFGAGDITDLLPTAAQFAVNLPTGFALDGDLELNRATAKALGLIAPTGGTDASITFSSAFPFDYDPSDGITPGDFDFVGVAIHEIGHALGFTSFLDSIDATLNAGGVDTGVSPRVLDLFRTLSGVGDADFTNGVRDLVPGNTAVSYLDFGLEELMSTGVNLGDGRQGSHFKDGFSIGIMDPTFAPGELGVFSSSDLRAFDLIGWDLASVSAVPVPAAVWLFGSGLIGLMGIARRKRV